MATYDATTYPLAFAHMEGGVKTVYVTPGGQFPDISSGDRIEFEDLGSITVGTIRRYETLDQLVQDEGFANVVPEAKDAEECLSLLRESAGWDAAAEAKRGVVALRVRWTKRKS